MRAKFFAEIRATRGIPKTGYDLRGISGYDKLRAGESRQWPCAPDEKNGRAIRYLNPDSWENFAAPKIYFPDRIPARRNFLRDHFFAAGGIAGRGISVRVDDLEPRRASMAHAHQNRENFHAEQA